MGRRVALIAGGGIGGLATALALADVGFHCHVLERRSEFAEAGAGIQIGPNGTSILRSLRVADQLAPQVAIPAAINVRDGRSGAALTSLPLGDWIANRHGSAYWTAHRADLHAALQAAAIRSPQVEITLGFAVALIEQADRQIAVTAADGRTLTGELLIGADGVNSAIRRHLFGRFEPSPTGRLAARAVLEVHDDKTRALADHVGVWLAPRAHVVHYPVRGGREIAVVVVTTGAETSPNGWATTVDRADVLACIATLAPCLLDTLIRAEDWRRWTLVTTSPLATWSQGSAVLLGDATGPILPFLAQGAAMALEDAAQLAMSLARQPTLQSAFGDYEANRRPRRQRVAATAARNGGIYHLVGPVAATRNLFLRAIPGQTVMSGYDWLYGYNVGRAHA